jgi:hypothetical protein
MNIPGANLLSIASRVIRFETLGHRSFISRETNSTGDFVSIFAASVDITGSMQPINRRLYQELGLNLSKNYATLYTSATVKATDRDREGDLITFAGKTWQCESDQNWAAMDGFVKMLCVEVPPYAG